MALPGDVTTFSLTFGHSTNGYTDSTGAIALVGAKVKLWPVDLVTGKRLVVTHVATGQVIVPVDVTVTIDETGKATAGPLPHTDNPTLSPVGFGYHAEWQVGSGSHRSAPRNKTFAVPTAAGATVDFDLLDVAEAVPGVLVPMGVSAGVADAAVSGLLPGPSLTQAAFDARYATDAELATGLATKVNSSTYTAGLAGKADTTDPRFSDTRTPTDGSVTNVKVSASAAISADKLADGTTNKLLTAAERTKLSGIAAGATANSPDATLLARANHTGTQSADTLTDGTTSKAFLATERTKLSGIATGATANSTDATLLARANHTGTQAATTITGLATVATTGAKADVGLGNVDNTSDASKPVSTAQQTALDTRAPLGVNNVVIGSGGLPTPVGQTRTALTGSLSTNNPAQTFMGGLHGYAYYNGTQQVGCGSIQGGAVESYADLTGTITQAVLGFEGIATVVGTGAYSTLIGSQSSVQAKDTVSVTTMIGFQGRAPQSGGGTPTVGTAYTVKLQEPTIGTQRYTYYGEGRHTFAKGTHATVLEILGTSLVKKWDVDGGGKWLGYASDGASVRMTIDPADTPTDGRFISDIFTASAKHVSFKWQGNERWSVDAEGYVRWSDSMRQTTVGAAGAAAALPATPTTYVKIRTASGTTLVIPAYLAA